MKKENSRILLIVTIFSIAMAFLESTVVVYLRKIYYPNGFNFPLVGFIDPNILNIEWIREFFTIVMLICIALLAGKKFTGKFAYFLYSFAIWDIFYYIWLKVILNWPLSLMDWDLLFLLSWPWISPVLAPIILSITMIVFALCILHCQGNRDIKIIAKEWFLLIIGSLIILYTFLIDYGKIILSQSSAGEFIPSYYNWPLFFVGFILIVIGITLFYKRNKK